MLNIVDKAKEDKIVPVFRLGFRPFFLLASLYGVLCIPVWLWLRTQGQLDLLAVPALWWHAHELIFGFAMTVVMGFVLTAVQNWTGMPGTKGWPLAGLVALWLTPRLLFWTPAPLWLILLCESAFILACACAVGKRVIAMKRWRNLFFIPLFIAAMLVNGLSYLSISGQTLTRFDLPFSSSAIWQAMIWWFALLLSIMGARVIPFFTAKRLQIEAVKPIRWLEWGANVPLIALFLLSFTPAFHSSWTSSILLIGAFFQILRLCRWQGHQTFKEPLLWSLHLGYAFIPVSLVMFGLNLFPGYWPILLHLITIGSIGGVILAMIARVTMGHTGRNIYQGPNMGWAFAALACAALLRTIAVIMWPQWMTQLLWLSAALWCFAFSLYAYYFGPMLIKPRFDGHPG